VKQLAIIFVMGHRYKEFQQLLKTFLFWSYLTTVNCDHLLIYA